ncbi:unnamed protein product [Rotaria magnacalcarata]|nr:unnamed protein product [Rotaria magnacalcarata]CAF5189733.1 unnamed protein product [Rotaria magnacalcarata]
MKPFGSKIMACSITTSTSQEYFVMPDILRILLSYLKYNRVNKAVYVYDNDESSYRIYELLELMNKDEYYNNFTLDLRTTSYEDVYSILYNIESNSLQKDQSLNYILLDLHSYDEYEKMLDKISHMGLYIFGIFTVC